MQGDVWIHGMTTSDKSLHQHSPIDPWAKVTSDKWCSLLELWRGCWIHLWNFTFRPVTGHSLIHEIFLQNSSPELGYAVPGTVIGCAEDHQSCKHEKSSTSLIRTTTVAHSPALYREGSWWLSEGNSVRSRILPKSRLEQQQLLVYLVTFSLVAHSPRVPVAPGDLPETRSARQQVTGLQNLG